MPLPPCAPESSPEIRRALYELGRGWAADPARPRIVADVLQRWESLLDSWIAEADLPLLVRKFRMNRGAVIQCGFGRKLVPTDNSPAQWAFAVAYDGVCPSPLDVLDLLEAGRLPVAMALSAGAEKDGAVYRGLRGRCPGTADAGWKLAHLQPVGLGGRGPIESYPRETIERHFRLFMSPANMFVVPSSWSGLAEVDEFLDGFQQDQDPRA